MPPIVAIIAIEIAAYVGFIGTATAILAEISIGITAFQASRARRQARDAFNRSLTDRLVMTATVSQARTRCYGRVRNVDGIVFKGTWGAKNEYYTLVIALCGHEIDDVEKVMFGDTELVLDGLGQVQTSPWAASEVTNKTVTVPAGPTTYTLPDLPVPGSVIAMQKVGLVEVGIPVTVTGPVVTFPAGSEDKVRRIAYQKSNGKSFAVVTANLGGPGQDLSTALSTRFPGKIIPGVHKFAGMACLVVELGYSQDAFPNGVPNPITAIFRAAKVYDPRTGVTAWSQNSALIARDWSLYSNGGACSASDLVSEDFIAAANACDVPHAFTSVNGNGVSTTTTRPMYTCGIVCDTSANPMETLSAICESMAGDYSWQGGKLSVRAGAYTLPAWTIDGDWLSDIGAIEMVKDAPRSELVNIITPTIANSANRYIAAPMPRVVAEAYVAVDGEEYPLELQLEGVTDSDHAAHIASVMLKDARAAKTYTLPLNLLGLQVKVGQNVTINIPEIGLANEAMRCIGWKIDFEKPGVFATFKSTSAAIFDPDATFKRDDALPNTSLPNVFSVPSVAGVTIQSGTSQLLIQSDGTIVTRALVSWTQSTDAAVLNGGSVEIRYGTLDQDPAQWQIISVPGSDTQAYILGLDDGRFYGFSLRFRNKLIGGGWGPLNGHQVLGKTQAPAAVAGLTATRVLGALVLKRTPTTEADWANTVYEFSTNGGTNWTLVPAVADRNGATWSGPVTGALKIRARDVDTSGNLGDVSAPIDVTVNPDSVGGASSTLGIKINVDDFAGTQNYNECYIHGRDSAGAADVDGTVLLNGAPVTVKKGRMVTGMGPVSAFIVYDFSLAGFPNTVGANQPWAMCRKFNGAWQYDNNTAWVGFAPTTSHYVIGLIQAAAGDGGNVPPGIFSATMLSEAWVPDSIAGLADAATASAAAAQTAANNAQSSANSALGTLNAMRSNGVLDASEKPSIIKEWLQISGERSGINAQADVYGITTQKTNYNNAYVDLANYLTAMSPAWNDTSADTLITPAVDQAKWLAFYNERQGLLNQISDAAGKVANWTGVANRPSTYRVAARGLSATGYPAESGLYDGDSGSVIAGAAPMYSVLKIHRTSKIITGLGEFDLLTGGLSQANAMAAALNSISSNEICVVFSYDEPQGNRMLGNLPAAMYRNGASPPVYGSPLFAYRGAYILVGIGGCGEGNGAEFYAGSVNSDANAWCDATFQITALGSLIVSGASTGATSLVDYGYLGSMDATTNVPYYQSTEPSPVVNGAIWVIPGGKSYQRVNGVWRDYVQPGSVGTGELGNQAATEVYQDNFDIGAPTIPPFPGVWADLRTFTVTPPVNCTLNFTALLDSSMNFDAGTSRLRWAYSAGGGGDTEIALVAPQQWSTAIFIGRTGASLSIAATGGVSYTFKVQGIREDASHSSARARLSQMKVEAIKR